MIVAVAARDDRDRLTPPEHASAISQDGVRAMCTRCGSVLPPAALSCPSCKLDLTGKTILDDIHRVDTVLTGVRDKAPGEDTIPDADQNRSELSSFSEPTDEEIDPMTTVATPKPRAAPPAPTFGSSDPPTRFVRGVDKTIELPEGSTVDSYEIESKLGAGAMGVVYAARHAKLARRVALKVMSPTVGQDPQALARFEREARTLASLRHPNIIDVYSFGTLPDGRSYFAMELLDGTTLDERLQRGRMTLEEGLSAIDGIAAALEAAHAQGIVHRDVKPSNVFLARLPRESRPIVKLLDLGLVKISVSDGVEKTASGAVVGTCLYLSPEQARGPDVDERTDIYALGCVAFEIVLGQHPFPDARTPVAAIAAHLTEPPPRPRTIWPAIPAALDLLMHAMIAKDPGYRPTAAQVRNVIASVRSQATAAGRAARAATEVAGPGTATARAWFTAVAALSLLAGILIGSHSCHGASRGVGEAVRDAPVWSGAPIDVETPSHGTASTQQDASVFVEAAELPKPIAVKPEASSPRPAPPPQPPHPARMDSAEGGISIDSKPSADVLVDDERKGRTPVVALRLHPGQHKITLISAPYSIKETFRVDVKAGEIERIVKDFTDRPEVKAAMSPTNR